MSKKNYLEYHELLFCQSCGNGKQTVMFKTVLQSLKRARDKMYFPNDRFTVTFANLEHHICQNFPCPSILKKKSLNYCSLSTL